MLALGWALAIAVSLPLALTTRGAVARSLGDSLTANSAASGIDYEWLQEFAAEAHGLGTTVTPSTIVPGAVLGNASAFLDGASHPASIVAAVAAYDVLWLFLSAAIIDRYVRDQPVRAAVFLERVGAFARRFAVLGVVEAVVYGLVLGAFQPWLLDRLYPALTRDIESGPNAFAVRLALYGLLALLLALCSTLFDYTKIRIVVENRPTVGGAMRAAGSFIRNQRERRRRVVRDQRCDAGGRDGAVRRHRAGGGTRWTADVDLVPDWSGLCGRAAVRAADVLGVGNDAVSASRGPHTADAMTARMPSASSDSTTSSCSAIARTAPRCFAMICRAVS